jgi:NAD-dependent dihydropyrimidine dehydrogenase PreA subunit
LITHYGYIDGSGEYFIAIDSDKCSGCGKCIQACPKHVLELVTEFVDLEDKTVAAVTEQHRKKISYSCAECKPEAKQTACMRTCPEKAIDITWKKSSR